MTTIMPSNNVYSDIIIGLLVDDVIRLMDLFHSTLVDRWEEMDILFSSVVGSRKSIKIPPYFWNPTRHLYINVMRPNYKAHQRKVQCVYHTHTLQGRAQEF